MGVPGRYALAFYLYLSMVSLNIFFLPQANKPAMGIVQTAFCGIGKFTLRDVFLGWIQVQNTLVWYQIGTSLFLSLRLSSPKICRQGKQILNMCISRGINILHPSDLKSSRPVFDNDMMIESGHSRWSDPRSFLRKGPCRDHNLPSSPLLVIGT